MATGEHTRFSGAFCEIARTRGVHHLVMDHIYYILSKRVTAVMVCPMYLQFPLIWLKSKYCH